MDEQMKISEPIAAVEESMPNPEVFHEQDV